jgi:DNA polymerase-1
MDVLGGFLTDHCIVDSGARATAAALYQTYSTWCEESGERQQSQTLLGKLLAERGFTSERVGKQRVRTWLGVGVRAETDGPDGPDPPSGGSMKPGRGNEIAATTVRLTDQRREDAFDRRTSADAFSGTSAICIGRDESFRETRSDPSATHNASACGCRVVRITDNDGLAIALPALLAADVLGLDVETTGLDPRGDSLQLVQLATRDRVYLIDPAAVDLASLTPLLITASSTIVGHNLGFDLAFLHAAGLPLPTGARLFDTMLASQVHDGGAHVKNTATTADPSGALGRGGKPATLGYHTLAAVAHRWLAQVLDKSQQTADWSGPLSEEQLAYAARDAAILLPLRDALEAALAADGLTAVAALEFGALPAVVSMEATGVPINVTAWSRLRDQAAANVAHLDTELATILPGVNVDSPRQLIASLANLGITVANAQEATLRAVVEQHPVVDLVLRRKDVKKRVSTYGDGYLVHVHPTTGRIHPHYRLIGAASGRMSCSAPNMQNIPREAAYRRCIRPSAGRVLVKADYSQIELRIAAQISDDQAMQVAFRAGDDLHTRTARAVLKREPTMSDRQLAKALNFGLLYGMGVRGLREKIHNDTGVLLSDNDAMRLRNRFFQTYPGLGSWQRRHRGDDEVSTHTLSGRPRHRVANFTEKLNSPVQGTGADILKLAFGRLWNDRVAVPSAVPVLAVHDEIVMEVDGDEAERCESWLRAHMEAAGAAVLPDVPVVVEVNIVADWSGTPAPMSAPINI